MFRRSAEITGPCQVINKLQRYVLLTLAILSPADSVKTLNIMGAETLANTWRTQVADDALMNYWRAETTLLQQRCLHEIQQLVDWEVRRTEYRRQLREMLGLDPLPPRSDLQPVITGVLEHEDFVVEKLYFQSLPGLYVTANLYRPRSGDGPFPTILYLCGHARVARGGVSLGNKTHYQHHAAWFARHGYVCLVIDSLQLGEIEGIHHGTYRYHRWWWLSRGYTPAGVEAWNCIRALDYLETRQEVDSRRMGVTGRSGGGAYSWWISALDDRIHAAVPVAGITDLQNHVVDGAVEGHCDCMYFVNTYRWDYPLVAALCFPRPLVISNTDRDPIFPLDGVHRIYQNTRRLYELDAKGHMISLNITAGGHVDTQELQMQAFRWFEQHLKQENRLIDNAARKYFEPEQLKVLVTLPQDQRNTTIDETFVPAAEAGEPPQERAAWNQLKRRWLQSLREKTFRGWPDTLSELLLTSRGKADKQELQLWVADVKTQPGVVIPLYSLQRPNVTPERVIIKILSQAEWVSCMRELIPTFPDLLQPEKTALGWDMIELKALDLDKLLTPTEQIAWRNGGTMIVLFTPRGCGVNTWNQDDRKLIQIRRRFYLLGQTLEGMQSWDIRAVFHALRQILTGQSIEWELRAKGELGVLAAYAMMFDPVTNLKLTLSHPPVTHREGPALLNVLRILDIPQALAIVADNLPLTIETDQPEAWNYLTTLAQLLGWLPEQLKVVKVSE